MASAIANQVQLVLVLLQVYVVFSTEVTFRGHEYISYDLQSRPIGARQNRIQLSFKTIYPTGMLIYSRGSQDDFVQLELRDGVLSFKCYLGGSHVTKMTTGEKLADSRWHTVIIQRKERQTTIMLDDISYTDLSRGSFVDLNLDDVLYFGGLGSSRKSYFPNGGVRDFRGCMKDVLFDNVKILDKAKAKTPNFIAHGSPTFKCLIENYELFTLTTPASFAKITLLKNNNTVETFSTSFKFRTFHREGVLVSRDGENVNVVLKLDEGSLLCEIIGTSTDQSVLKLGRDLDDGDWHEVKFMIAHSGVKVSLDGQSKEMTNINQSMLMMEYTNQRIAKLVVGKRNKDNYKGFVGCLLDLIIDDHKVKKSELTRKGVNKGLSVGVCTIKNKCNPNPCKNGGRCLQDYLRFRCDCSGNEFEGQNCEMPIYKASCAEYANLGLNRDAHCLLDSDRNGEQRPFTALCNASNAAQTFTVISHRSMKKTLVKQGARWDTEDFIHEIVYPIGMVRVKALVNNSKKCRQYIRYDCLRSKLYNSHDVPHWRDSNNKLHTHWGGADPDTRMCLCGKENRCISNYRSCNCDSKKNYWRYDDGFFTTPQDSLPVTMLNFPQSAGEAYFTLGPLECWGTNKKHVTTSRKNLLSQACSLVVEPTASTTTVTTRSINKGKPENKCNVNNGKAHCPSSSIPLSTAMSDMSTGATLKNTTPKQVAIVDDSQDETSSSGSAKRMTIIAIVLISFALIIVLLLMLKFVFPRLVLCIRTHSKRGEYVVPPTGTPHDYVVRLMPYVAGRRSRRGRHSYQGYHEKQLEWSTSSPKTSYWV